MWPFKKRPEITPDPRLVKAIGEIGSIKVDMPRNQAALIGSFGLNVQPRVAGDGSMTVQAGTGTWSTDMIVKSETPFGPYVATKYHDVPWTKLVDPTLVLANWQFMIDSVPLELDMAVRRAIEQYAAAGEIKFAFSEDGELIENPMTPNSNADEA